MQQVDCQLRGIRFGAKTVALCFVPKGFHAGPHKNVVFVCARNFERLRDTREKLKWGSFLCEVFAGFFPGAEFLYETAKCGKL